MKRKWVDWKKNEQRGRVNKKKSKKNKINEEVNKKLSVRKREKKSFNMRKRTIKWIRLKGTKLKVREITNKFREERKNERNILKELRWIKFHGETGVVERMKEELKWKTNMKRNFETSWTMTEMSQSFQSLKDKERMN